MKKLIVITISCAAVMFCSCLSSRDSDMQSAPYIMVVDLSGEIGWIRAPVCYYSKNRRTDALKSIQSLGLEPSEAPAFELDTNAIASLYAVAKGARPDTKRGRMNFIVTCFFRGGRSKTFRVGRADFKAVLEKLPESVSKRPRSMYASMLQYNNP